VYRLVLDQGEIDLDQDVVLVGRRAGVDVALPFPDVGGVHLRLEREAGGVFAVASGAGPAELNGQPLPPGERRRLADGDELLVAGRIKLGYRARSPARVRATSKAGTRSLARKMLQELVAGAPPPTLELPGGEVRPLPPVGKDLVVGRGESCDVVIEDPDLSREHVRIRRGWATSVVVDLESKNGTRVGGEPVPPGGEVRLTDGARIEIGSTTLLFRDPAEELLRELTGPAREPRRFNWRIAVAGAAIAISLAALVRLMLLK
jgi:pSer/pThr/pTyr-binding forkhead associated (FHA) protein